MCYKVRVKLITPLGKPSSIFQPLVAMAVRSNWLCLTSVLLQHLAEHLVPTAGAKNLYKTNRWVKEQILDCLLCGK